MKNFQLRYRLTCFEILNGSSHVNVYVCVKTDVDTFHNTINLSCRNDCGYNRFGEFLPDMTPSPHMFLLAPDSYLKKGI
jgi:hypothetical protein